MIGYKKKFISTDADYSSKVLSFTRTISTRSSLVLLILALGLGAPSGLSAQENPDEIQIEVLSEEPAVKARPKKAKKTKAKSSLKAKLKTKPREKLKADPEVVEKKTIEKEEPSPADKVNPTLKSADVKEAEKAPELSVPLEVPQVAEEAEPAEPPKMLVDVIPSEAMVEVLSYKPYTHYKDRRTRHGFLVSFGVENMYFPEFTSGLDQKLYEELFGQEDVPLLHGNLAYKFNFFLGSIALGFTYGQGTLIDDRSTDAGGIFQERSLTITKEAITGQIILDNFMKEPYMAPYVGMSYHQLSFVEDNLTTKANFSETTNWATAITIGALIQLNWLEPEASRLAYQSNGLENTYLDIFWTQYQATGSDEDPILDTDFNIGAGLRLEF